ncbi:MAG: AAA family ATPase [Myxococcota bacterium]
MCHERARPHLGRERELAAVAAALDALAEGRGTMLLVTGEPGIGKTRLADEACRRAGARGSASHGGRGGEAGGAPAYWAFVQVLRGLARACGTALALALGEPRRDALAELMPELRAPDRASAPAASERFQLFDAVAAYLDAAVARAPLVMVLDDLHAADPSSLLLLQFIARELRGRALLVIGTYREAEARRAPEVGATLARVARDATVLPLSRLSRTEVHALVQATLGAPPSQAHVDALHHASEGNPLFVHELLRLPNAVPLAAGRLGGIGEVVRARLALLPPEVRALLEVAAVLGREFALDPWRRRRARSGCRSATTPPRASSRRWRPPSSSRSSSSRWRFTHVLLREALYLDLPPATRARLHHAAATELTRRIGGPPLGAGASPAPRHPRGAARRRRRRRARRRRARHRSARLRARLGPARARRPARRRRARRGRAALRGAARARHRAHAHGRGRARGREACLAAAAVARRIGDGRRLARAALGSVHEFVHGVRDEAIIALLEEALAALPPDEVALRARCLVQLAAERMPEPDPAGPLALVREAIALARQSGDRASLRTTLAVAGMAMLPYAETRDLADVTLSRCASRRPRAIS